MKMICVGFVNSFIFFQINGGSIKIHIVQSDSNNICPSISNFFSTLCKSVGLSSCLTIESSDYQAIGLSSHWIIDMHPNTQRMYCVFVFIFTSRSVSLLLQIRGVFTEICLNFTKCAFNYKIGGLNIHQHYFINMH